MGRDPSCHAHLRSPVVADKGMEMVGLLVGQHQLLRASQEMGQRKVASVVVQRERMEPTALQAAEPGLGCDC